MIEVPAWYRIAEGELGIEEIPGIEDNPRILEYKKTTIGFGQHDEISWCSDFVNWCMMKAGEDFTRSQLARSWINYGVPAERPEIGDICIFRRGAEAWQGHVGFFAGYSAGGNYRILGGNQGNMVCFMDFPASKLVAIRRPRRSERRGDRRAVTDRAKRPDQNEGEFFGMAEGDS